MDGEAELLDLALGLLLGAELPQAVLLEAGRERLAQIVQQVVVEVIHAALRQGGVEHGAGLLGVLGKPGRQLRGDGERFARVALHKGLAKGPFRLAAVVAAGGIEVGEPRIHEDVHELADLVDIDGRGIIRIPERQAHEPEPERRQLVDLLHGNPLLLCARAKYKRGHHSRLESGGTMPDKSNSYGYQRYRSRSLSSSSGFLIAPIRSHALHKHNENARDVPSKRSTTGPTNLLNSSNSLNSASLSSQ